MKISTPKKLAIDLMARSTCSVQVAAVLSDNHNIYSWGWNHTGDGLGQHAEIHAMLRANKRRLQGSTITVAGQRKKSQNIVLSMPCMECMKVVMSNKIGSIEYRSKEGEWLKI